MAMFHRQVRKLPRRGSGRDDRRAHRPRLTAHAEPGPARQPGRKVNHGQLSSSPPVPPVPPPGYDPARPAPLTCATRPVRSAPRSGAQSDQMRYQMRGMRRGSVLGPILLIAIGVVFLLIQTGRLDHDQLLGLVRTLVAAAAGGRRPGGAGGVGARSDGYARSATAGLPPLASAAASSSCFCSSCIAGIVAGDGFSFHGTAKQLGLPGMPLRPGFAGRAVRRQARVRPDARRRPSRRADR